MAISHNIGAKEPKAACADPTSIEPAHVPPTKKAVCQPSNAPKRLEVPKKKGMVHLQDDMLQDDLRDEAESSFSSLAPRAATCCSARGEGCIRGALSTRWSTVNEVMMERACTKCERSAGGALMKRRRSDNEMVAKQEEVAMKRRKR